MAKGGLEAEVHLISGFLTLNKLSVELVVFFDEPLVLVLERQLRLGVQLALLRENRIFVLDLLESLGGLEELVQHAFHEGARFDVCKS